MVPRVSSCVLVMASMMLAAALAADADAQTAEDGAYVVVKGGANAEHAEDGLTGASGALGIEAGFALSRNWALDFEFWLPAYFHADDVRHRDVLVNVSAIRLFGERPVRPFVVIGGGSGWVQTQDTFGHVASSEFYVVSGAGMRIRVADRFELVPEVRVNYALSAIVVRPSVGILVRF
jgi:hypothetical protein